MTEVKRRGRPRSAKHGTRSMYVSGCRCEQCSHADRLYKRQWQADIRGKLPESREEFFARLAQEREEHGSSAYQHRRCRCEVCRAAWAKKHGEWAHRHKNQGEATEHCVECDRWFTPHGLKCHNWAMHGTSVQRPSEVTERNYLTSENSESSRHTGSAEER